jgi:hypothetical protein
MRPMPPTMAKRDYCGSSWERSRVSCTTRLTPVAPPPIVLRPQSAMPSAIQDCLSRDFRRGSIFDFFNSIGQKRFLMLVETKSAFTPTADIPSERAVRLRGDTGGATFHNRSFREQAVGLHSAPMMEFARSAFAPKAEVHRGRRYTSEKCR